MGGPTLRPVVAIVVFGAGLVAAAAQPQSATPPPGTATAVVLEIEGAIGPATSRFIERGIESTASKGARLLVLQMDTPGGLDSATRDIIRAILASKVPVAAFVAPPGSRAASAGTYILYASHIAAMAPATNLGAATPVSIGGEPPPSQPSPTARPTERSRTPASSGKPSDDKAAEEPTETSQSGTAMERKVINDSVAYIRGLARLRGRNADWAEQSVRDAASLPAEEALERNVIDLVARDIPDLLARIDGREVALGDRPVRLETRGLTVERLEPDWRTQVLSVLTNPTIAYGLLLIGLYGLLLEGYNPGAILPGVVGAIALILALFAFQILSVNWAGLALMALGVAMIVAEFFVASFGALGLGGLVAFVVGSIILLDTDVPGLDVALPLIGAVATAGGLVVLGIGWLAGRSVRRPVATGVQAMIGATAEAAEDFSGLTGRVRFGGELWNAHATAALRAGQPVRITKVEGLWLWVEPV